MNRASFCLTILCATFFTFALLLDSTQADSIVHFSYTYDGLAVGGYDVQTYSGETPVTTKNFLRYVNNGVYDNTILDRDSYNYIIQGGGFTLKDGTSQEYYPQAAPLYEVPTYGPIANEPGLSNLRGTIAMSKLSDNPNSAASQWYVNLSNTNTTLDDPSNNGGYTVFGKILGQGMDFFDDVDKYNPYISFTDISGTYGNPTLTEVPLYITEANHYLFIKLIHAAVTPAPWLGGPNLSGDWGAMANWGGVYNNVCVPEGPGSKISLDNQTTTVNTLDMATVGRTVGSIKFTGDSTLISSSGGYHLTLDNIDQPAVIDVTGSHTISAPVVLAGDARFFGSGVLNMTAGISGNYALSVESGTLSATSIKVDTLSIGNSGQIVAVPEPSTAMLLGLAFAGLFFASRRGKR